MKAIVRHRYGTTGDLELATIDEPEVGPGQVLVRVEAAGLDMGVWHLVTGLPYLIRPLYGLRRPKNAVLGGDVAGRVAAVGPGVTRVAVGDEVFGVADGSYAEFAVAEEADLARRPAGLDATHAAAVATSGLAALQGLRDRAEVRAGDRVLVIGASGGVGSFAVQIATSMGAHVTGVASTAKLDLVRSLGADEVIDYTTERLDAAGRHWDVVLEAGGRYPVRLLRRLLTPEGTLVFVGGEGGGRWTGGTQRWIVGMVGAVAGRQTVRVLSSSPAADDLDALRDLLAAGDVVPSVERTYPLADAADAIDDLRAGRIAGKAVIAV